MKDQEQARQEFLARRRLGIGGSDVSNLWNIPPYGCERKLHYDKSGATEDYPMITSGAMRSGIALEDAAAAEYEIKTGRTVRTVGQRVHPDLPWARVHIDRSIEPVRDLKGEGNLELKVVGSYVFKEVLETGLKDAYVLQLQHSFLIPVLDSSGDYHYRTWGAFGILCIGDQYRWEFLDWDVEPDTEIIEMIERKGGEFWSALEAGELPERLEPDSVQCQTCAFRVQCQGERLVEISEAYPKDDFEKDSSLNPLVERFLESRSLLKDARKLHDENADALKEAMGKRTAVIAFGQKVKFPVIIPPNGRINVELLRHEKPEIAEEYSVRAPYRQLRVDPLKT